MSNLPDESTIASLEGMGYTPERIREIYANNNEGDILQEGIYNAPKIIKGLHKALGGRMVESRFRIPKSIMVGSGATLEKAAYVDPEWAKENEFAGIPDMEQPPIIQGTQKGLMTDAKLIYDLASRRYDKKIDIGTQMIQEADPGFGKDTNARFLYDNLFSLGDSLMTIAAGHLTGGLATLPLLGLRKSADTTDELMRKGINPRLADEIGLKSGINEFLGEAGTVALLYGKLPLKWVATKLPDKVMSYISPTIKNVSRGILGYVTELFGENVTEVLDRKLQNNLINHNYSIQDAINEVLRDTSFQKGLAFQSAGFALLAGGQGYVNKFGDFIDKKIGESETIKKMADYIAPSQEQLMQRYKDAGIDPSRRFRERGSFKNNNLITQLGEVGVSPENAKALLDKTKTINEVIDNQLGIQKIGQSITSDLEFVENEDGSRNMLSNPDIGLNIKPQTYIGTFSHEDAIQMAKEQAYKNILDILNNPIGSIMVYNNDELKQGRTFPSLGKHFNDVNPQHGDKWTVQFENHEPFEVNILGRQDDDVLVDIGGGIKRLPIDKIQFVKRTGDHYIPRLYTGPLSKDIVTENPDTLYVALSYGDRDAKLIGENVTAIDINERAMINQLTPEEMKLFIASKGKFDWRYAAIDKEVDRIKKLATGLQTQAETYTYRVTPKTYDRLISNIATYNQAYLDKKGGVVEVPEGLVYNQEFTETKTTKDPETDKDIFSLRKREKASYEFGAGIGEVVKIESAGREPLLLQVESTKPSQYKGQLTYILKPFVRKPTRRFTDVVVPEVMGRTNYINIKNSDPMLYKYLYQKMHELNSFVNRTKGLQTPKTITYAGREVAVNGLETFTSKGIPIYNTEYGLMTGDGEVVRTPEEITNKPKKTIWVTPGDTIKSNEALLKPTVSVEDLKVGDVISLENYSQFKPITEGKYYKQTPGSELKIKGGKTVEKFPKMKPVHVRITRKIDYVKDLLNLQKTEDERGRQTFVPTNTELSKTMTSKLGKNDKFLGTYFRPDNKIGQFYPGRSPYTYIEYELVQEKPKEKPARIQAKVGTAKPQKTLNQILAEATEEPKFVYEPMGENELKDEDFGSWRHEVTEEINLQLSGVKGDPFTEWSNNLSEATRIKDNAKIAQLIQEGKAFMDEDKVVRMVESLERKYGMMPFQMSFVEYANTQGAELSIIEDTAERPKYTPKEVSLQWGMNPTPPTKETRFPVMLPTGKAKVEGYGDVTYTLPYGEQEIENEPSIRGYREVVISSPDVSTMYFEHLESCVDALEGGLVSPTSDISKRMFYEHPELLQTEYAAPYKAELMARVKLLANAEKVKAELLAMKKEDRVLHPAISKMIAEGAKGVSDAAASIRENQEVGTTVEQTEQKQQDLKKEAKDMDSGEGLVSSFIDTFTEIFTDETGAFGNLGPAAPGFEKLRAWLAVPGNKFRMKYMSNNEPTPLGIKRQKFETAMAICRNNIDRLSDLANSVGQNSKSYFEAILRSKGFSPQDASFLADEFHKQVFPRLVLGAQNKAIQTSMLKESHKRKPGYTTKEAMQSSAKKFWKEKMVEPVKEFLKTVDMIISGTREKTVSQGKHGLKFFPYVPPEMRTWLREFESQLPRHIKAQLMTVDQILFARMDEIEKQLVTDYIEAAENLQTFRHDNLYMRTQYILDGHTEEQANDYMLRLETMLLNEVYGKANEIGQRNENSINNIFHSISQYKVLCARNFDELQRRGKVAPWQRRDFYIHHQVLEYSEEWFIDKVTMRPSKISKKPIRGYSEQRGLSEKEHQEAKPESLIASIMNPWIDNLLEDAMNDVLTKYDKTYEFITSNLVLGKNYTMVPNKMLDKVINRDGGNRFALTPEEAQKTEKKQCAWLKEGAEVDINGTPYIAVAKTYYTLKFDHDPVSGYRIMDGSQETWLIPKSVNDAINSLTDRGDGLGAKLMRGVNTLTRLFKRTAIMTVWPVFQMTNMIGDTLQMALLAENRADIIRHLPFTLKYVSRKWLEAVSNGKYVPKLTEREARIEDWMDRKGIIDSDSMAELMKGKYSKAEWVIQLLEQSGTARENVLRVALAASLYDQMMDGTPEQINKIIQKYDWITYDKEATTWEDKLANIARTLCIDYMRQSDFYRKTISGMGLPFGHWFLQSTWLTAKKIKSHPHMLGALMLPALFAVAWNYSDPEREKAEKNAPIGIRNKFHLFYKWGDEMKLLAPQLPFDSLPIINLPNVFTYSVARMLNGEISPEELPKEFFKQGVNTNSEMFRRLLHPITRWVNGMFIHQDPNDRAQVYPEDLKELSDADAAKYAFYFFMKCNAPFFGNYISRNYMKRQTTDWMDMVELWYKPMKWAGFRDELPAGVGVEVPTGNKSILGGLLRGDTTSSKFSGQDIIEVEEKLAQETGSIRRDLVSKFEMYPIGKDSVAIQNKAMDKALGELRKLYPNETYPQIVGIFMENVQKRLKTPKAARTMLNNALEYVKDHEEEAKQMGIDKNSLKEIIIKNNERVFVDTIKRIRKEARQELPFIINNIMEGNPSKGNIKGGIIEGYTPSQNSKDDLFNSYIPKQ